MIPRCRTVGRSTIAAGLDLSQRRRHTRTRRLSLDKQKRDSSENTTLCHSVIHVDLARHHSKRWRLFGGVNCSLHSGRHECKPLATNRREMVLKHVYNDDEHDDERSGRSVTATDNAAVAAVRNVVEADRRVTIDEIMIRLPPGIEIGRSSIGTIMSVVLNFRKVCARWVPRLLSENHKQQRMEAARAFLEMLRRDGDVGMVMILAACCIAARCRIKMECYIDISAGPSKSRYSYAQVRSASVSMELPLVNVSTCEFRSVIRFFTAKNETAINIHRNLVSVYGEGCMSIQMRSGRSVTATDNAAVAAVRNVVEADRRVTIDEIMIRLPPGIEIGRSSIGTIMSVVLNFRKVCARWVPRLLSENHKQQRMEAARAFLEMLRRDGDQLFSHIVTGDESWVHHSTPETKRQSMVWKKPEESAPKKAMVTISAGKVMTIVFLVRKGVLLVDYLPPNTTVNAARYCEVLTKLRAAIKRKRPGLLSRKVLLVHDNARPHADRTTQTLLENFKWKIFTHLPYSPDLAPSDFHLFPALKLHLGGMFFANDDEVQAEANHWLRRQDTAWYNSGIKKLLQLYQKCLDRNGDYIEKNVRKNFLGNVKAENYSDSVNELLLSYKALGYNMSLKIHFLHSSLDLFPEILVLLAMSMVRGFIKIYQAWRSGTKVNGVPVCLLTTAGHSRRIFHKQSIEENPLSLIFNKINIFRSYRPIC
ncbi:hypothetical protein LAZ67_17002480 [Cordylochernes scorpioides]|uniref:Transposase n=1 Tax=Cordylochernes scorpioides TaxID=51811 RepID=A0ABY6LG53_9ARAC|nr:hypothetical protein LAZ67_17002480 [Cordylochernes scorpioides]